jgi:hypothetical protein
MKFRIAKDKWFSKEYTFSNKGLSSYDKFQHFIGGVVATLLLTFFFTVPLALTGSMLFWFLWEVKDGIIPWEARPVTKWPILYNWGGDGFSWRDMIAAWAGALSAFAVYEIFF